MRIVSQDRTTSINLDVVIISIRGRNQIFAVSQLDPGNTFFLGIYDTPERTQEVFEDLHNAYAPIYSISTGLAEEQLKTMLVPSKNIVAKNIINADRDMCLTTYDNYVYYMPKE